MTSNPIHIKYLSILDFGFSKLSFFTQNDDQKNIWFSLLLIFPGYLLYAQDVEDKSITEQIWLDYNPAFSLSEKVDVYGDIGARTIFPNEWYRFVVGPSVRYKPPKLISKHPIGSTLLV